MDNLYDKIGDIGDQFQDVNGEIRMVYENQITSKQVYCSTTRKDVMSSVFVML